MDVEKRHAYFQIQLEFNRLGLYRIHHWMHKIWNKVHLVYVESIFLFSTVLYSFTQYIYREYKDAADGRNFSLIKHMVRLKLLWFQYDLLDIEPHWALWRINVCSTEMDELIGLSSSRPGPCLNEWDDCILFSFSNSGTFTKYHGE